MREEKKREEKRTGHRQEFMWVEMNKDNGWRLKLEKDRISMSHLILHPEPCWILRPAQSPPASPR